MAIFERARKLWAFWYYSYILHTGLYMLEEWERNLFKIEWFYHDHQKMNSSLVNKISKVMKQLCDYLAFAYVQYSIHIGLTVLEPWERKLFNSFLLAFIGMASYTAYLFLPGHIAMLTRFIEHYLGTPGTESVPDLTFDSSGS